MEKIGPEDSVRENVISLTEKTGMTAQFLKGNNCAF
jgi:hypothetical protein